MTEKPRTCSIILAAGKGTRIGLTTTHKTCLPVAGKAVIVRSIEACRAARVSPQVVVVGFGAQHVMRTAGRLFPDVLFAYQAEQSGTGNAAKCGARVLTSMGYDGDVLVMAGDKVIGTKIIRKMMRKFRSSRLDCLFLIGRREDSPSSGRVIFDEEGQPVRIIEVADIRRARALLEVRRKAEEGEIHPDFVARAIAAEGMGQDKAQSVFGELYDFAFGAVTMSAEEVKSLIPGDKTFFMAPFGTRKRKLSAQEAESAEYVNLSVYLLRAEALEYAVKKIKADNAQNEEYLTDVIEILAAAKKGEGNRFKLGTVCVESPDDVMGFNNLEELRAVEERVRQRERGG